MGRCTGVAARDTARVGLSALCIAIVSAATPGPPPPTLLPPVPDSCGPCVDSDMVWCYHDDVCYRHGDPIDGKPWACPGTSRCAANDCDCKTCEDKVGVPTGRSTEYSGHCKATVNKPFKAGVDQAALYCPRCPTSLRSCCAREGAAMPPMSTKCDAARRCPCPLGLLRAYTGPNQPPRTPLSDRTLTRSG